MEMIGKVSKGSKMDQIYIPKKRVGFRMGSTVVIRPVEAGIVERPYFYNVDYLEPVKVDIIMKLFLCLDQTIVLDNALIIGSFLDRGFCFNDVDLIIVGDEKDHIGEVIRKDTGINCHILLMDANLLRKGMESDPLFQAMLSRFVAKKRIIFNIKKQVNYKLLDLHLLQSKVLAENFFVLHGEEKYKLVRNLITVALFLETGKVTNEEIEKKMRKEFGRGIEKELQLNMVTDTKSFLVRYRKLFRRTSSQILKGIKNESKQK